MEVRPARGDASWVLDRRTGAIVLLDNSLASVLPFLGRWRPPAAQVAALENLGVTADASETLRELNDLGFLMTRDDFLKLIPTAGPGPARRIDVAAWCTRDRTLLLQRSMDGFVRNFERHGHKPTLLVLDDSKAPENQAMNKQAIRSVAAGANAEIHYAGEAEKRSFVDRVLQQDGEIPRDVLEFALSGLPGFDDTTGANRNVLHLATCGSAVFSTDDDTICQFAAPPDGLIAGVEISSLPDPNTYEYFLDAQAMGKVVSWEEADILGAHLKLMGASPHELDPILDECSAGLTRSLVLRGGAVVVTMTGVCGDSGFGSPRNILAVRGSAGDKLMSSEGLYRAAAVNRLIRKSVRRPTLSGSGLFQGMCGTVDNRRMLPPCMPVLRNWDGVFGHTLRCCYPDALVGHVPWAVRHDPPGQRAFPAGALTRFELRFSELLGILFSGFEKTTPPIGADRMGDLGNHLLSVAGLPDRDFLSRVRSEFIEHAGEYLAGLEKLLAARGGRPPYWSRDLQAHMDGFVAATLSPEFGVPVDLARGDSQKDAVALTRELVGRFGDLLCWWTEIREAAASVEALAIFTAC